MPNKHTPANDKDQRAKQAKVRLEAQRKRGSKKFGSSNPHNGGARGQSGQKKVR